MKIYSSIPSMVGDEDEGVEEMPHRAVESAAVREAPVPTALINYIYISKSIYIYNYSTMHMHAWIDRRNNQMSRILCLDK